MDLTVLGCSGTYAGPGGACSGYLLRTPQATIWLDAGAGTLANLQQHVDPVDLDAVVISHEHPDHWLDLPLFRNLCRYVRNIDGVPVYGTAGTRAMLDAVCNEVDATFAWTTVHGGDTVDIGDITLRFSETDHPVETLAVLMMCDGRSLAYSADTGPDWGFEAFGLRIDVALCEASFADGEGAGGPHISGAEAARSAAGAGAERLLLTHVVPGGDPAERVASARKHFDGDVIAVETHQSYTI